MKIFLLFWYTLLHFTAHSQSANFTYSTSNGLYCNPSTVNFIQTCTGNPIGFSWSFGNGAVSFVANPSITFSTQGSYTVKLTAVFENSVIETSQTISINPSITALLTCDRNYICTPGNINFTATSTGNIATYDWNFGDGTGTISTNSATQTHAYASFGSFVATVKATDVSGCFATSSIAINVQNPPISGNVNPIKGCIPALVNFNSTVTLPIGGTVTNYSWNFGDASNANTGVSNTTHNYPIVGNFSPSVTILTNEGCTNTYNFSPLAFGTPPTSTVAAPTKLQYCGSETSVFNGSATNANSYYWDFGDGNNATTTSTTITHRYLTLGTKTVTLTPYFNGCAGAAATFNIDIVGVIASFNYSNTCGAKNIYSFTNTSQGNVSTYVWSFGDASANVGTANTIHTYPTNGNFITNLLITDNISGCTDNFSTNIFTATPNLVNPDLNICKNSSTTFTVNNNYSNPNQSYTWNVLGQIISNNVNPFSVTANTLGNYANNFVVISNGSQSCLDTIFLNHSILVRGPNLSFTAPANICLNNAYNILNTSMAFINTDTVKIWYWNYGKIISNDTIYQPPTNYYTGAGTYQIKLVGIDINGCKDSLIKPLIVYPIPFLRIFPRKDTICLGKSDSLFAFHSDNIVWMPASSLSCSTCDTTIATPLSTTQYIVTATNSNFCFVTDTSNIVVFTPFQTIVTPKDPYICLNNNVQLNVVPNGKKITWSPSTNINNTTINNPIVSPIITTQYKATLTDSLGCFSSADSVTIHIKSLPIVNAGPDQILPYNSNYSMSPTYSNNVVSYTWTPSTLLTCNTCAIPNGVATYTQNYVLTVISDSNCIAKDDVTISVDCKYSNLLMPTAFTPDGNGINDYYYPLTRGIKTIKKFIIYNRYGQMVFQNFNFEPNIKNNGWNGKKDGLVQEPNTYVYILEAICELGETLYKKGTFILLK